MIRAPILASPNGTTHDDSVPRRVSQFATLAAVAVPATVGRIGQTTRRRSFSYRSVWSVLSAASVLSVASAASLLSIGSFASILSIGSSVSILSIGSDGGFLSIGKSRRLFHPEALGRSEHG